MVSCVESKNRTKMTYVMRLITLKLGNISKSCSFLQKYTLNWLQLLTLIGNTNYGY